MYSLHDYGSFIADSVRMDAYVQALRQSVKPESVVLDIGTGTGIFALLACQFGAHRVYAIEPNDAIQVAREIAAANGYSNRIEFIQNISTKVTLPERADVVISDLRGVLPFFQHHIPFIVDVRKRLLSPKGVLIPQHDTLWAAVVEAAELYGRHYTTPWDYNKYGIDMGATRRIVTNTWRKERIAPEQLLADPQCWATLDYTNVESPDISSELNWTAARKGTAHGFIIWFDATLVEGLQFSNAPGAPELIYGSAFFPWSTPVPLALGDKVSISLEAKLVSDDYILRWDTVVLDQGDPMHVKANFKQSTFFGVPLSPAQLHKQAASHVPTLNEDGEIDRLILSEMDGKTSLDDIARQLLCQFPNRFAKWHDALGRVGEFSKKYSF